MELLEFVIELDIQYCLEVKRNMILFMTGVTDINSRDFLLDKKNMKIFLFMTFYTNILWVQYHCVLGLMK